MNTCDVLVASIYILSAAIVVYSVNVRCRADLADVERHRLRHGVLQWYAFRAAGVVVLLGGFMHGRYLVGSALDALFFKRRRSTA